MSEIRQKEILGEIRESETAYARLWNENGKTYFQTRYDDPSMNPIVEITQEDIDTAATGKFDGCTTIAGIPWSWGPCDKFEAYLSLTGRR